MGQSGPSARLVWAQALRERPSIFSGRRGFVCCLPLWMFSWGAFSWPPKICSLCTAIGFLQAMLHCRQALIMHQSEPRNLFWLSLQVCWPTIPSIWWRARMVKSSALHFGSKSSLVLVGVGFLASISRGFLRMSTCLRWPPASA